MNEQEVKKTPVEPKPEPKKAKIETEKKPKTPKKPKTVKRHKTRTVAELMNEATKTMSDKEKDNLIAHLRDLDKINEGKMEALKNNCERAYEQARELENQYHAMEDHYRTKLQFIDEQTRAFMKAITLSTRGGLK